MIVQFSEASKRVRKPQAATAVERTAPDSSLVVKIRLLEQQRPKAASFVETLVTDILTNPQSYRGA